MNQANAISNPKCPICEIELEYDEHLGPKLFDLVRRDDTLYVKEICAGHCSKCHKHYTWNTLYIFSHNEELENEDAD